MMLHGRLAGQQCLTSAWWAQTRPISCSAPSAALSDASCTCMMVSGKCVPADDIIAVVQLTVTSIQLTAGPPDHMHHSHLMGGLQLQSDRPGAPNMPPSLMWLSFGYAVGGLRPVVCLQHMHQHPHSSCPRVTTPGQIRPAGESAQRPCGRAAHVCHPPAAAEPQAPGAGLHAVRLPPAAISARHASLLLPLGSSTNSGSLVHA